MSRGFHYHGSQEKIQLIIEQTIINDAIASADSAKLKTDVVNLLTQYQNKYKSSLFKTFKKESIAAAGQLLSSLDNLNSAAQIFAEIKKVDANQATDLMSELKNCVLTAIFTQEGLENTAVKYSGFSTWHVFNVLFDKTLNSTQQSVQMQSMSANV